MFGFFLYVALGVSCVVANVVVDMSLLVSVMCIRRCSCVLLFVYFCVVGRMISASDC